MRAFWEGNSCLLSPGAPDSPVHHRTLSDADFLPYLAKPTVGSLGAVDAPDTVRCTPDSVRCANGSKSSTVGCARLGKQSALDTEQCLSDGAPDCPVHHPTEGKNCLPRLLSTTPRCLGAIKGTPRRMEENTKQPLSIVDHSHFTLAH